MNEGTTVRLELVETPEQRGLACPARSDKGDLFTGVDLNGNVFKRNKTGVADGFFGKAKKRLRLLLPGSWLAENPDGLSGLQDRLIHCVVGCDKALAREGAEKSRVFNSQQRLLDSGDGAAAEFQVSIAPDAPVVIGIRGCLPDHRNL